MVIVSSDPSLDAEGVKKHLDGKIARFKQPKAVFVVDALPRNAMGKVQKNILRERYSKTYTS